MIKKYADRLERVCIFCICVCFCVFFMCVDVFFCVLRVLVPFFMSVFMCVYICFYGCDIILLRKLLCSLHDFRVRRRCFPFCGFYIASTFDDDSCFLNYLLDHDRLLTNVCVMNLFHLGNSVLIFGTYFEYTLTKVYHKRLQLGCL